MKHLRVAIIAGLLAMATTVPALAGNGNMTYDYHPHTPSQEVECMVVDNTLAKIPHGDGDGVVTKDETGPGGWRYNGGGRSFVTFAHDLDGDQYIVDAGRSNVGSNSGIINDYPEFLDLPQDAQDDVLQFSGPRGVITLTGGDEFQLPGPDNGEVHINLTRVGPSDAGGNIYEGCAKAPQLTNFGFTVVEGGDFVQQEYFKVYAETDASGTVVFYEWTEISTFNNTNPDAY